MQNKSELLSSINSPADLRKLSVEQLPQVCDELREFIIKELSHNPGHLASSLGAIEITVAVHYVFNTPYDKLVWDVGHQAYGHKILTGRREQFCTNRQYKGLCGFVNPAESEYDSFISGHASNSISAALGLSVASLLDGHDDRQVVAVIGDGALSGGLAFEGLNNASENPNNLFVILNDNHMAIDSIHGGMSQYLLSLTTSRWYNRLRYETYRFFRRIGWINDQRKAHIQRCTNSFKALLSHHHNMFEGMDIRYFGPVDGHDVKGLVRVMRDIKDFKGPKVLHCITKKGKGYKPAEEAATVWHAPGRFDVKTGKRIIPKKDNEPPKFQEVFGHTVLELADHNDKIVGVSPAMLSGCGLSILKTAMPNRCFDVGIAEGHAVTFSAGLAKEGLIPFCNVYSSFMQRAYDNIIHDVAIQNLHVILCLDRAGIVGADGATHHGAFDLAYLRCIPNIVIASPYDEMELRNLLYTAQLPDKGTFAIRYPRGKGYHVDWESPFKKVEIGTGRIIKIGRDLALLTVGPIGHIAEDAIKLVEGEMNVSIAHYDMRFVKPLDVRLLSNIASSFEKIITIEDGVLNGGFGSSILEYLEDNNMTNKVLRIGYPDRFIDHGTPPELYHEIGMDVDSLRQHILNFLNCKF